MLQILNSKKTFQKCLYIDVGFCLCIAPRVSFGSSKGSMVETLIYDSALAEDRIPEEGCIPHLPPTAPQHIVRDPVALKLG